MTAPPFRQKRERGAMQAYPEAEGHILCSATTVLECRCGQELILLGREEDWYSEGRTTFECRQCGRTISLTERRLDDGPTLIDYADVEDLDEEAPNVRDLIRSLSKKAS